MIPTSTRRLISVALSFAATTGSVATASFASTPAIAGRNPAAFALKIFIVPAVKVTTSRNTSGTPVVHAYRARPIFTRIVVPRQNAITASN